MSIETAVLLDHGLWRIDRPRSAIEFRVRHFGVATLRGRFGLEWEALRDAGRVLVADEVRLAADVVLTRG